MRNLARAFALTAILASPAWAGQRLADVEIYDRTDGRILPVYRHDGRNFVAGTPGHEYEIVVNNRRGERLLAVASVDGVNVVTGQTASTRQTGYVLNPHQTTEIEGWRKSMDHVAAFYFTRHHNAYATRTGRPDDVGVIGVALYREAYRDDRWWDDDYVERDRYGDYRGKSAPAPKSGPSQKSAPGAPSAKSYGYDEREESLGTGHGREYGSGARYADFERRTSTPEQVITIYYDSHENLVAQGVIPSYRHYAYGQPRPFPGHFVPDPPPGRPYYRN